MSAIDELDRAPRSQPTYEELKPSGSKEEKRKDVGSQPTYEELKPVVGIAHGFHVEVFSAYL